MAAPWGVAKKNRVAGGKTVYIGHFVDGLTLTAQRWKQLIGALAGFLSRGQHIDRRVRVSRQQPQQFRAGVPGAANDANPDAVRHGSSTQKTAGCLEVAPGEQR